MMQDLSKKSICASSSFLNFALRIISGIIPVREGELDMSLFQSILGSGACSQDGNQVLVDL